MTTFEAWRIYTKSLTSPNTFIEAGFYSLIAAALQRRVWIDSEKPLYCNPFIFLVGEAALGKGLVLDSMQDLLKHHKYEPRVIQEMPKDVKSVEKQLKDKPLLFPLAPDDTTYQQLLRNMTNSRRIFPCPAKPVWAPNGFYAHKSITFCLDEAQTLFDSDKKKLCSFLLKAFDCRDYDYETKHEGVDRLRKIWLNLIAGTTPAFMRESYADKILGEGLASRLLFVFEFQPRFIRFGIPKLDDEQLAAKKLLIDRLLVLSKIAGPLTYTPEAFSYLQRYFETELPLKRVNSSIKLNDYYHRKNVHVPKLAILAHFADQDTMEIGVEDCKTALNFLARIEKNMHYPLQSGDNKLFNVSRDIIKYLQCSDVPKTWQDIWMEFAPQVKEVEFAGECMKLALASGLIITGQIEREGKPETVYSFIGKQ